MQISVTLPEHLGESGDEEQILAYVQDHLDTDRWTAKAKKALFGNAMMLCSTYGCDPKPPGQPGNTSYNENHLTADQFISVKEDLGTRCAFEWEGVTYYTPSKVLEHPGITGHTHEWFKDLGKDFPWIVDEDSDPVNNPDDVPTEEQRDKIEQVESGYCVDRWDTLFHDVEFVDPIAKYAYLPESGMNVVWESTRHRDVHRKTAGGRYIAKNNEVVDDGRMMMMSVGGADQEPAPEQ